MSTDWNLAIAFLGSHPKDAARILGQADPSTVAAVISRGSPRIIAETLSHMEAAEAAAVLHRLPAEVAPGILSELPLGAAALILRPLDSPERDRLLAAAEPETARSLRTALSHAEGTAGAVMDSKLLALPPEISVGEARQRLRRRSKQTGNYLYVVDEERKPIGAVSLGQLMLASPKTTLTSLMRPSIAQISARASAEMILAHPGWRELHALPVVDSSGILVGVLRRETYERLREDANKRTAAGESNVGLALTELFWTLAASAVDELAQAARSSASRRRLEE